MTGENKGRKALASISVALSLTLVGARLYVQTLPRSGPPPVLDAVFEETSPMGDASAPPVELQLEVEGRRIDIVGGSIELSPGEEALIERNDSVVSLLGRYQIEHSRAVAVTTKVTDGLFEIDLSATGGVMGQIIPMNPRETRGVVESLARSYAENGMTRAARVPTLVVGDARIEGAALTLGSQMSTEIFLVPGETPAVVVIHLPAGAGPFAEIGAIVASLRRAGRESAVAPALTLVMGESRTPLVIDQETVLPSTPPRAVTLRRRPTVRRVLAGLVFEHDPTAAATETLDTPIPILKLTDADVAVQLAVAAPQLGTPEEALVTFAEMLPQTTRPATRGTRTFGNDAWPCTSTAQRVGGFDLEISICARRVATKTVVLTLQFTPATEPRAVEIATGIATTIRRFGVLDTP